MFERIAQSRIHIGLACGALAFVFARSTPASILAGSLIALPGEALRFWASGHLEKGREVTRSGPYRFVRHPLYLGSAVMGAGFIVAAHSWWATLIAVGYVTLTYVAAMRTEEAALEARFGGEYAAYRAGQAAPVSRA